MANEPDFTWTHDGFFYSVYPETEQAAENMSRFMAENGGSNKYFGFEFEAFKKAATAAGYTVRKCRGWSWNMSDEELLDELTK